MQPFFVPLVLCACCGLGVSLRLVENTRQVEEGPSEFAAQSRPTNVSEDVKILSSDSFPHQDVPPKHDEVLFAIDTRDVEWHNALNDVIGVASHVMVPVLSLLAIAVLAGSLLSSVRSSAIPDSATTVAVAVLLGLGAKAALQHGWLNAEYFQEVNSTFLKWFLLPIIFQGGWTLQKGDVMSQLEYSLLFATLGTAINTLVFGFLFYSLDSYLGYGLTFREAMVFAALISVVDPLATVSIYCKLDVRRRQPLMNTLVLGESVINNAVAIIIFDVINSSQDVTVGDCAVRIANLLFVSLFFGLGMSIIMISMLRFAQAVSHATAFLVVVYIFLSGYLIFCFAEVLGLSGVIAALSSGIMFRLYAQPQLPEEGQDMCSHFLEVSASLADRAVFLLCGISAGLTDSANASRFGLIGLILCFLARAICVFICSAVSNLAKSMFNDPNMITSKQQFMMWHGGLKGGISLVLALEIDGRWCHHKSVIVDATLIIICALLLICGSTTNVLLEGLGLLGEDAAKAMKLYDTSERPFGRQIRLLTSASHSALSKALTGKHAEELHSFSDQEPQICKLAAAYCDAQ